MTLVASRVAAKDPSQEIASGKTVRIPTKKVIGVVYRAICPSTGKTLETVPQKFGEIQAGDSCRARIYLKNRYPGAKIEKSDLLQD